MTNNKSLRNHFMNLNRRAILFACTAALTATPAIAHAQSVNRVGKEIGGMVPFNIRLDWKA